MKKILITILIGFTIAMVLMAISIYFGYSSAYSSDVSELTVDILGLPIYILTDTSNGYVGQSIGINMGIICGICVAISIVIEEVIRKLKNKG